jgi:hypothetical protein
LGYSPADASNERHTDRAGRREITHRLNPSIFFRIPRRSYGGSPTRAVASPIGGSQLLIIATRQSGQFSPDSKTWGPLVTP